MEQNEVVYRHTPDMGEISGFGGEYEACCQDMLEAGVKWIMAHPERGELAASGLQGVYGIFKPESEDAKALEKVLVDASKGELTGAMHHAVMYRLFYISKNGWDKYCEELRKREKEESA